MAIKHVRKWTLALALVVIGAGVALAAVTFDPETGEGFVGKGDVQLVYGWNNKQLQDNASLVQFRASSVEETSWLCRHNTNPNAEDQERSITTTIQGLVDDVARDTSKGKLGPITGFDLLDYDGVPTTRTEGPVLHSCGAMRTYVEGSDETTELSGVEVSINGTDWFVLQ